MSRNNSSLCDRSNQAILTICTTISRHAAGFGHCYWRFFRPVCFVCCVMARCDCVYKTTAKRHQNNSGANTQSSSSKWHCQESLLRGEESREAVMNCVLSRFKGFLILWMGWQFIMELIGSTQEDRRKQKQQHCWSRTRRFKLGGRAWRSLLHGL